MKYLSVCSGIEAASVAWHPLGWQPFAFSEIEKFPSAVLAHHYPSVPNLGDMTKFKDWPDADIDVLVGGTPCQSFSVAGLRQGLADPRGNLCLTFLAVADKYRPEWLLWENVPGVLSSDGGRDFGAFLGGLGQLGYGWSYRVLDAQYVRVDGFGRAVPQRRRRVFVVGNLRDWRRAAAVLFERESLQGDTAPRREAGKGTSTDVAPSIVCSGRGVERAGDTRGQDPVIAVDIRNGTFDAIGHTLQSAGAAGERGLSIHSIPHIMASTGDVSHCLNAGGMGRQDYETETVIAVAHASPPLTSNPYGDHEAREDLLVAHSLRSEGFDASEDGTGRGTPLVPIAFDTTQITSKTNRCNPQAGDACHPLAAGSHAPAVALGITIHGTDKTARTASYTDVAGALRARMPGGQENSSTTAVQQGWAVRRLTPVECERLQGFPDEYTNIPWRSKNGAPDGPRYKALGNSMAVNAMRWLGRRIEMVSPVSQAQDKTP